MRTKVFISYSHADEAWLRRFQVHLKSLGESSRVLPWDDSRIKPGQDWRREIREALETAVAAVLLVSADFLGSKFIKDNELPPLLAAAEEDGLTILPVILKPCRFRQTPSLERFQTVNDPDRPMVNQSEGEREAVWVKTVDCIEAAIRQSSPEARLETELAQIREEVRAFVRSDPDVRKWRKERESFLREPSMTAADRYEAGHILNTSIGQEIVIFLSEQLTDSQLLAGRGSGAQRRCGSDRLQAVSLELDRWLDLGKTTRLTQEYRDQLRDPTPTPLDEAIDELLR